jgi:hypothetical protein
VKKLATSEQTRLNAQVVVIRAEILAAGESIASCAKLLLLCPDVAISGQWDEIARIAIAERWSFCFYPNGDVCFTNL